MENKVEVAQIDDLADGNLVSAQVEGVELVAVGCNNTVTVFEGRCPHQGTLLSEGVFENVMLVRFKSLNEQQADHWKSGSACQRVFSIYNDAGQFARRL